MACLVPNTLYHQEDGSYTFKKERGYNPFSIPCGQCLGCRIDHCRDWSLRCMHHAKQFEKNCFITLTFDEIHLAGRKSVNVKDFQDFMKRFRSKLKREKRPKISYFHSTEYGEKKSRPHHHAVVFNYFPPDAEVYKNVGGNIYYKSQELSELWHNQGFIVVGELTLKTAAYTASYTFKKIKQKDYPDDVRPEKMTCSQGIGVRHFLTYYKEYCELGHIIYDGKRYKIPRAYLKNLDLDLNKAARLLAKGKITESEILERRMALEKLKTNRELNARQDDILDRHRKYTFLIANQERYKKKLCNDSPLSEDNRYLKQLTELEAQIMYVSGEYNPEKQEKLYARFRSL